MSDETVERQPRFIEAAILGLYIFVVGIGIAVHESWFDEAQAWLLARDAPIFDLLNTFLRYEGHPPLWYLILKVPASLGLPYKAINVTSALIGVTGVVLLLLRRDVPRLVKALLPFTFFVAYQYTIIARSYAMILPLLLGVLAIYRQRRERLWLFVLLVALLCQVSLHGTSIAGALVLLYAYDVWREGVPKGPELRKHIAAAAVLLLNVAAIAWMLRPPHDLSIQTKLNFTFSGRRMGQLAWHGLAVSMMGAGSVTELVLSLVAFTLLVLWFWRRRTLGTMIVLVASLLPICSIYFGTWHEGLFVLVIVFTIILSFMNAQREPRGAGDLLYDRVIVIVVSVIFLHSIVDTWRSYRFDISYPYSGSTAAADFIKEHRLDRARLFGAGFSCLAIEPYFDHNVFANYQTSGRFAFWDWSTRAPWFYQPAYLLKPNELRAWQQAQIAQKPDFFLTSMKLRHDAIYAEMLIAAGYKEIARFPGGLFWKDHVMERETFRLFARGDHAGSR